MGLDMYLCKNTKGNKNALDTFLCLLSKKIDEYDKAVANVPFLENGWQRDVNKMTDEQKKLNDEFYCCYSMLSSEIDKYICFSVCTHWYEFNILHDYIIEKFANGDDKCKMISLSLDNLKQIISYLEKILESDKNSEVIQNAISVFSEVIKSFNPDIEDVWYQTSL